MISCRKKIIANITKARIEKGISQQQLAEMIGTKRSNICRIESGEQNITLDMFIKIAIALDQEISLKLTDKNEKIYKNVYNLKLYDKDLIRFSLYFDEVHALSAEIISVEENLAYLFPMDLEISAAGIVKWLNRRVIPKNRTFVGEILQQLGLDIGDTKGIIDICKGLSLNDSYWVTPDGFEGSYDQYNLYENRFSEILSLVAYTGEYSNHHVFTTSPELTTGGNLPKAWRFIENDGIYLYKGGTIGGANTGKEPYSEFYACQVADCMGINAVNYDIENWKGILASKCKLFTNIDVSFVPIGSVVKAGGINAVIEYYKELGGEIFEDFKSMIAFDAVIFNEDRHFGNFGLLRDNKTGKIIGSAPLFDNGLSLFSFAMPNNYKNLEQYSITCSNPYGVSYNELCKELIGNTQRRQLRKLMNFQFKKHNSINLPDDWLRSIEKQIKSRAAELLSISRIKNDIDNEIER